MPKIRGSGLRRNDESFLEDPIDLDDRPIKERKELNA